MEVLLDLASSTWSSSTVSPCPSLLIRGTSSSSSPPLPAALPPKMVWRGCCHSDKVEWRWGRAFIRVVVGGISPPPPTDRQMWAELVSSTGSSNATAPTSLR